MKFAPRCTRQNANVIVTGFHSLFVRGVDAIGFQMLYDEYQPKKLRIIGLKILEKYQLFKL